MRIKHSQLLLVTFVTRISAEPETIKRTRPPPFTFTQVNCICRTDLMLIHKSVLALRIAVLSCRGRCPLRTIKSQTLLKASIIVVVSGLEALWLWSYSSRAPSVRPPHSGHSQFFYLPPNPSTSSPKNVAVPCSKAPPPRLFLRVP